MFVFLESAWPVRQKNIWRCQITYCFHFLLKFEKLPLLCFIFRSWLKEFWNMHYLFPQHWKQQSPSHRRQSPPRMPVLKVAARSTYGGNGEHLLTGHEGSFWQFCRWRKGQLFCQFLGLSLWGDLIINVELYFLFLNCVSLIVGIVASKML